MSAVVSSAGTVRQLDVRAEPDENFTETDAEDPPKVARLLIRILRELASLRRRWRPRRIDFEDRSVDATGTTKYRFDHGFGGRVRFWPVEWSTGTAAPNLKKHSDTDNNTLILVSTVAGTVTVRVEEAG